MIFKVLVFLCLIPSVSLGLVTGENIEVKVLNLADKQMITSRGGADAIFRGEFVRIMQDGRFKGRAIAIQVLPDVSQWALYYQYEPISYALPVTLKPSSPHDIPIEERNRMNLVLLDTSRLQSYVKNKYVRPKDDTYVDPEQERLDKQLKETSRYTNVAGEKTAIQEAQDRISAEIDELVDDSQPLFSGWKIKAGLSPASFRRVGSERNISLRTEVSTSRLRELSFDYQIESRKYRDQLSGDSFDYQEHRGNLNIDIIKLNENMSLFSYATFEKRKQGQAYPLRSHINFGPIGLKYDFLQVASPLKYFDLSYVPTFDYQKSDYPLTSSTFETRSQVGLRHTMRARVASEHYDKKLTLKYEFLLRPMQETGSFSIDSSMTHISSMFTTDWKFNEYFSLSYVNDLSRDPRRRELQGISATDMIHSFYFNFNSNL